MNNAMHRAIRKIAAIAPTIVCCRFSRFIYAPEINMLNCIPLLSNIQEARKILFVDVMQNIM
jgi:hypothetical protein